jgi:hypothetical protein
MLTGFRANNPGNLRRTSINWKGKLKNSNNPFEIFTSLAYGTRALLLQLQTDIQRGNNTINLLIRKYAPSHENDTQTYINNVVNLTGFKSNDILKPTKSTLFKLSKAISLQETGRALTNYELDKGWNLLYNKTNNFNFLPIIALSGIVIILSGK